jgi:hypothetical protein
VPRPTPLDELFVHQLPEMLPHVSHSAGHWRESYFFDVHRPDARGDVVFLTMAHYPATQRMDSIQMGRVGGESVLGVLARDYDGDPQTTDVGGARVEVVRPFEELRLYADPEVAAIGMDLTFRARTQPYGLRRGTMRAGEDVVWDRRDLRGRRVARTARSLVGGSRPRSLSAVVVVPDPVRGRVPGRLALGAGQWCPGVHRWMLGRCRP